MNYCDNTLIDKAKYAYAFDSYYEPVTCWRYDFNIDTTFMSGFYDIIPDFITHCYYETYTPEAATRLTAAISAM